MLKTRIIPILLLKGNSVVKTVQFSEPRMVGDAISCVKVFSARMADEMVIVDIEATARGRINEALIRRLSRQCVMPLTIGGGISTLEQAEMLFRAGADKVVVNSGFFQHPALLADIANKFGRQAVVFALDVRADQGNHLAVSHNGREDWGLTALEAACRAVEQGAGEIIVQSVDRDGLMNGYDLALINRIANAVEVPVVAAGGCGSNEDCVSAIRQGASAVAAGSLFHWVGESVISLKEHMHRNDIEVRLL